MGADDCDDMEGCGIRAGDQFLASQLGAIMASPAWRTQRSLAIITFDEDAYDHEHPAQRVATLVLGSAGVRAGLRVARPLHPLQPAADDRGRARARDADPQRPLRAADQRRLRRAVAGGFRSPSGRPATMPPRSS